MNPTDFHNGSKIQPKVEEVESNSQIRHLPADLDRNSVWPVQQIFIDRRFEPEFLERNRSVFRLSILFLEKKPSHVGPFMCYPTAQKPNYVKSKTLI